LCFGNKKCPGMEDLSGGRSGRTTGSPTVWWYTTEERSFFRNIASRTFKACIFIVASSPELFFTLRNGVVGRTICLSQEAVDGGAVAAQNCGRWYSFLWPGHKLHFFRHWKSFKIASIFTKYLVKNCSEKKKVWRHGRLWRPTWTDWLKKGLKMQVMSFLESKNVINLKSWHSIPPLKIGEISYIFLRWRDFYNLYSMYLSADPGALRSWVGNGTFMVSLDPKHSYTVCTYLRIQAHWRGE